MLFRSSAVPEIIGSAGSAARNYSESFAVAIKEIVNQGSKRERALIARRQAEKFSWNNTIKLMLRIHNLDYELEQLAA